jgi:hypothetical protein
MDKVKTPLIVLLTVASLLIAVFLGWKFFNPYAPPPPFEGGLPSSAASGR